MKRLVAAVFLLLAAAIFVLGIVAAMSVVREYGPAEGYGNLAVQALPIVTATTVVAGALTWMAARLMRR